MAERQVTADLAGKWLETLERLITNLRANDDMLVPLADCGKYTDLTYQQCWRLCMSGHLAYTSISPFSDRIYVLRSSLKAATAPPRGRPPKQREQEQ